MGVGVIYIYVALRLHNRFTYSYDKTVVEDGNDKSSLAQLIISSSLGLPLL